MVKDDATITGGLLESLRGLRLGILIVCKKDPIAAALLVVLSIAVGALAPVPLMLINRIVSSVQAAVSAAEYDAVPYGSLSGLCVITLLILVATSLSNQISARLSHTLANEIVFRIHECVEALPLDRFDDPEVHRAVHRARFGSTHKPMAVLRGVVTLATSLVTYSSVMGLISFVDLRVVLLSALSGLPILFVDSYHGVRGFQQDRKLAQRNMYGLCLQRIVETKDFAADVRSYGAMGFFNAEFMRHKSAVTKEVLELLRGRAISTTMARGLASIGTFAATMWVVRSATLGMVSVGDVVMIILALQKLESATGGVYRDVSRLYEDSLYMANIVTLVGLAENARGQELASSASMKSCKNIESIVLRNVSFRYCGETCYTIKNICLEFSTGGMYVLVGENGGGKSTLLKILGVNPILS